MEVGSGVVMNMPFLEARKKSSVLKAVPAPKSSKIYSYCNLDMALKVFIFLS